MSDDRTSDESEIQAIYDRIAEDRGEGSSCCPGKTDAEPVGFQPSYEDVEGHVPEADLGLGCGIPLESGELEAGETVLDLGSGAGNDCFVARRGVGSGGTVIGVDFSEEMLRTARANAKDLGYDNVEFRQGLIEDLPVEDASVDVVVSNCVLNLVPDKRRAFEEIKRVLKPGGYFSVSDIVLERKLPDVLRDNVKLQAGCVASALLEDDYLGIITKTGFDDIEVVEERHLEVTEDVFEDFSPSNDRLVMESDFDTSDVKAKSITVRGEV